LSASPTDFDDAVVLASAEFTPGVALASEQFGGRYGLPWQKNDAFVPKLGLRPQLSIPKVGSIANKRQAGKKW
jgi:hypothetical protein